MIAQAATVVFGLIIGVHDADTVTLLTTANETMKVRLAYIDAPELGQSFGKECKKRLSDLAMRKQATVTILKPHDRYGRVVGEVHVGSKDASTEMVSIGCAWVYRQYAPADSPLIKVEEEAAEAHRTLWSVPKEEITPPWIYRKRH